MIQKSRDLDRCGPQQSALEELGVELVVQVPQVHGAVAPTNRLWRLSTKR